MPSPRPILYVEDEENDVFLVKMGFERAGIQNPIHVAPDGVQALEYLLGTEKGAADGERSLPSLVLLDLNLPRLGGFEVLQRLRQEPQLKDLPVVIFSSSEQPPDKEKGRALGADEYIVKPGSLDEIIRIAQGLKARWLG